MKRQKKLLVLCLAFALLLGCYGAIKVLTAPKAVADSQQETYSLGIADSLTSLQWKYEDVSVNLSLTDSKWTSDDDSACPLDQMLVKKLATQATGLYATKVITDPESASAYGFDSDEIVTLSFGKNNTSVTLTVGNTDPYGNSTYVMLNNDLSKVYLVNSSSLTAFVCTLNDLVEKETLPAFTDVLSLELSGKTNASISFSDGGSTTCYTDLFEWFLQDGNKLLPLDPDAVDALLSDLTTLTWGDCVNYNADAAALATYGLSKPSLSLQVLCNEGTTATTTTIHFGDYNSSESAYYARLDGSKMVYLVSKTMYETLTAVSYDSLRTMDVLYLDWFNVREMDVTADGVTHTITLVEVTNTDATSSLMFDLDGTTVETKLGTAFLTSMSNMQATEANKIADGNAVFTVSLRQYTLADRTVLTISPSGDGYVVQINGSGDLWITAAQYKTITDAYAAMLAA